MDIIGYIVHGIIYELNDEKMCNLCPEQEHCLKTSATKIRCGSAEISHYIEHPILRKSINEISVRKDLYLHKVVTFKPIVSEEQK